MRALNRALLARQFLLDRVDASVPDAVEHLVGATVHMVTPRDAAFLRPLMQPAIERRMGDIQVDAARVLLGHADRTPIIPPGFPWGDMLAHGRFVNNVLVDGMLRATWWLDDGVLAIRPFGVIPYDEVEAEARRMAAFAGAHDVRFEPALP